MAQDGCVSYLPIMKFQSLKISNTLLIKRVIHYKSITNNRENDLQNTTKNLQNDLEYLQMTFDFAILKLEIDKNMKTKKTLNHLSIPKTHLKPP